MYGRLKSEFAKSNKKKIMNTRYYTRFLLAINKKKKRILKTKKKTRIEEEWNTHKKEYYAIINFFSENVTFKRDCLTFIWIVISISLLLLCMRSKKRNSTHVYM